MLVGNSGRKEPFMSPGLFGIVIGLLGVAIFLAALLKMSRPRDNTFATTVIVACGVLAVLMVMSQGVYHMDHPN